MSMVADIQECRDFLAAHPQVKFVEVFFTSMTGVPRGKRLQLDAVAPLAEVINGPAHTADGTANLVGALRRAMATTGYSELKEFQRVGIVHAER